MAGVDAMFAGTQNDGFQWNIGSARFRNEYMEEAKKLREKYGPNAEMDPNFQRDLKKLQEKYASNPATGYFGSMPAVTFSTTRGSEPAQNPQTTTDGFNLLF